MEHHIVIVRHGETYDNARAYRPTLADGEDFDACHAAAPAGVDPHSLNAVGLGQATALGRHLASLPPFDVIMCSTITRARESIAPYVGGLAADVRSKVEYSDDLVEFRTGADYYEMLAAGEIEPDEDVIAIYLRERSLYHERTGDSEDFRFRNGESGREFMARVAHVAERIRACPRGARVLIMAHGGFNGGLLLNLLQEPQRPWPRQDNACVNLLALDDAGRACGVSCRLNATGHLPAGLVRKFRQKAAT